jgi:DNA-directed RNA polymerase subunit RPC12/RpoP
MNDDVVLECTRCQEQTDWERESETVVRCADCEKRHSTKSLDMAWGVSP